MNRAEHGAASAVGFGVAYLLAGTALLLQELDLLTLNWSYLLPLILITVGAAVLISGLLGAHRSSRTAETATPTPPPHLTVQRAGNAIPPAFEVSREPATDGPAPGGGVPWGVSVHLCK